MILLKSNLGLLVVVVFSIATIVILSFIVIPAFAQQSSSSGAQQYLNRRVEIWALFYRGMIAAFVVGAVVQGSIVYVAVRFREGNKKNIVPSRSTEAKYR